MSKKDLVVLEPSGSIDTADKLRELQEILEVAERNKDEALAANTRRAYASQWNAFAVWCASMGLPMFPTTDKVLLTYLTDRQRKGSSASTLGQAYAAIREEHRMRGEDPPKLDGQLYRSWTGALKNASRSRQIEKAKALTPDQLRACISACGGPLGPRDQALLLVGWCGALRREEIVNLNVGDIQIQSEGLRVLIRKSKTDQMGEGHEIGIARADDGALCPVGAWEDLLQDHPGGDAAFPSRTGQRLDPGDVSRILIRRMKRAKLDVEDYSAHSLRSGCITAAAQAGFSLEAIQRQSRHKSLEVLMGYIRTANLFKGNITKGLI